jgi:hypothetical protein
MRLICSDNFGTNGIIEIQENEKCLYNFNDFSGNTICIVSYKEPNEVDKASRFAHQGEHPGYAVIEESNEKFYRKGEMFQWDDDFFIQKIDTNQTLEDFPEYFI